MAVAPRRSVWARGRCRISPPRFLAECCKRQLNQGSFVLLYFRLSTFSDLYWVCLSVFSCTVLFVSISQVIGCEDRLRNDLYCVECVVKLCSNQPTDTPSVKQTTILLVKSFAISCILNQYWVKRLDIVKNTTVLESVSRQHLIHTFQAWQPKFLGYFILSENSTYAVYNTRQWAVS